MPMDDGAPAADGDGARSPGEQTGTMTTAAMIERPTAVRSSLRAWLTVTSLAIGAVYAVVVLVWTDGPFAFTFDDAYYYFGIARNVAEGNGSTFDGINATNGYHPLWLALAVPAYLVGLDGMAAVRALLVVQVACYAGALVVLGRAIADLVDAWPGLGRGRPGDAAVAARRGDVTVIAAFALFAANPFVVKVFVNGLESGISVLLYAVLLVRFAAPTPRRLADTTSRWRSITGLLLLLVFLARTDAAILAVALCLWAVAELRHEPLRRAIVPLAELFAPVGLGALAYLAFNEVVFGTPMQVSGLHKRAPLDGPALVTFGVLAGLGAYVGVRAWRRAHAPAPTSRGRFPRLVEITSRTGFFAAFCFVLLGYYNALQTQQWLWYYAPLAVYALLLLPVAVADFVESTALEAPPTTSVTRALAPVQAILLVPLALGLAIQVPTFVDPEIRSIQLANQRAGAWIDANLPADAVLGSWDAGVVGYFAHRPVVNLDGVANSYEYYEAARAGTVDEFLADEGVGYLVNHGRDVDGEDPDVEAFLLATFGEQTAAEATVVERFPFRFSGVTMGSGGVQAGSDHDMAVFVYRVPLSDAG